MALARFAARASSGAFSSVTALPTSVHHHAAIGDDGGAVHEGCGGRNQPGDGLRNLIRGAEAIEAAHALNALADRRVAEWHRGERRVDHAGCDRIDGNSLR